jgi:hypothetical protein
MWCSMRGFVHPANRSANGLSLAARNAEETRFVNSLRMRGSELSLMYAKHGTPHCLSATERTPKAPLGHFLQTPNLCL